MALGIGGIALLAVFTNSIVQLRNYRSSGNAVYHHPGLSLLFAGFYVPSAVLGAIVVRAGRTSTLRLLPLAAAMCVASVYANRKDAMALALLMLAAAYAGRRLRLGTALLGIGLAAAAVLIIFNAYSINRGGGRLSVANTVNPTYGLVEGSDAGGPFISIDAVVGSAPTLTLGRTYLDVFALAVPKALWPGRPLDLAEGFARLHVRDWQPGQGLGYSPLAEAYQNFGPFGVAIQYLVLGFGWGYVWRRLRMWLKWQESAFQGLYCTVGYFLLLTMNRGPVSTGVKSLLVLLVPILLVSVAIERFGGARIYRTVAVFGDEERPGM